MKKSRMPVFAGTAAGHPGNWSTEGSFEQARLSSLHCTAEFYSVSLFFPAFLSSGRILSCLSSLFTGYMRQHKVVLFNLKGKQISARLHPCLPALYNLLEMNI